jgi:hypothetical protein
MPIATENAVSIERSDTHVRMKRHTFQERDVVYQTLISWLSLPLGHDYTVLRLQRCMVGIRVEEDDFTQISVQVG